MPARSSQEPDILVVPDASEPATERGGCLSYLGAAVLSYVNLVICVCLAAGGLDTEFVWSGIILLAACVAVARVRRRTPLKSRLLLIAVAAGPALAFWSTAVAYVLLN